MPKKFERGIAFYTEASVNKTVYFPENEIKCQYCEFCRAEKDLERYWCRLTNNMIYNPFALGLPDGCPLKIISEREEKENV